MENYERLSERQFMHRSTHFVLSAVMLWLAYVFLDDVPTLTTNPAYSAMAAVMSETDWGHVCLVVGMTGITSLFVRNYRVRMLVAVILGSMHGWIAFEIWKASSNVTAPGLYIGYALLGLSLAYSTGHLSQRQKRVALADLQRSLAGRVRRELDRGDRLGGDELRDSE